MKRKIILPFLGASVLALISVYFYLGGFNPIELKLNNCSDLNLVGLDYLGIPQDETIGEYFREVEAARKNKPLHTIYYIEPEGKRDSLHVFIGYESGVVDQKGSIPWTQLSVKCQKVIVASLKMSRFVMPGPEKTKKAIEAFAQENGLSVTGIFIDKIISSNHVEVWAPVDFSIE
ncbi:hypothetical protein [uncultured Cyclobacterium sp.]|uniref:hypothetical protein n=1 Tax=uncultured Cyclobacterium sp. TaxID=453820 RepID=UPI0030EE0681|tara:strand:- start:215805 stop:216329 length:525 start_codon:yes stop_codon:yes gene_type:complete